MFLECPRFCNSVDNFNEKPQPGSGKPQQNSSNRRVNKKISKIELLTFQEILWARK
jgi:hypothetical protein